MKYIKLNRLVVVHRAPLNCGTKSRSWKINYLIARIKLISANGDFANKIKRLDLSEKLLSSMQMLKAWTSVVKMAAISGLSIEY
jgi:hypothetical protein